MVVLLSVLFIVAIPAVLLYALVVLEPFALTRRSVVMMALVWGIVSYVIAWAVQHVEIADLHNSAISVALAVAPLLEEALKITFLLVIYNRTLAYYSMDGLIYGFAIGSGFAVMENLTYVLAQPDQVLGLALSRIITTGLFHAGMSGFVGMIVGSLTYYRRVYAYPIFLLLYLLSVVLHHIFNLEALLVALAGELFSEFIITSAIQLFILIAVLHLFRFIERWRLARRELEGLTDIERVVIKRWSAIMKGFDAQAARLGAEQSGLLRSYLMGRARVGILTHLASGRGKRANTRKLQDEVNALRERLHSLEQQLSPGVLNWIADVGQQ